LGRTLLSSPAGQAGPTGSPHPPPSPMHRAPASDLPQLTPTAWRLVAGVDRLVACYGPRSRARLHPRPQLTQPHSPTPPPSPSHLALASQQQ
jgi:hypothetical protein